MRWLIAVNGFEAKMHYTPQANDNSPNAIKLGIDECLHGVNCDQLSVRPGFNEVNRMRQISCGLPPVSMTKAMEQIMNEHPVSGICCFFVACMDAGKGVSRNRSFMNPCHGSAFIHPCVCSQ
jgi:hypothetical protein